MNEAEGQNLLCDVTLVAGNVSLAAHKVVLAACSSYFKAMFTCRLSESTADKIDLRLLDSTALEILVDFMYTSELYITEENVQALLPGANILQLFEVKDACCDFLQSQLHPSNCIGIRSFADLHACADLAYYAHLYTQQHFVEVAIQDEFLNLPLPQMIKLISDDRLLVQSEEQVYEAVISWTMYDFSNRQKHIDQLIEYIRLSLNLKINVFSLTRLPLLSQDFLVQRVEDEPLIKNCSRCKDFLIEAMKYHLLKPEQKLLYITPRTKPRSPAGLPKMMLVIGGQAPKAIKSVECYDFKENKWHQVSDMPSRRCRCGVAVLGGLVYAIGGFNGSLRVRTVDVYEPIKDVWTPLISMEARRSTLGAAVLNGLIYAVGGFDGSSGLSSAECFDPRTNEWRYIASMSLRRSSVGVGVLGGLLFAVGGYDGASRHCLSSVEAYSATGDKWLPVPDMTCRRSGAGVGTMDGLLYAVGGHDGPFVRKSVECYNPETKCWSLVASMHMCRRNAGVVTYNNMLYVVGGDDGMSNLSSVECYCPKSDAWTLLPHTMHLGRSYAGVCIIDRPM
ncbi:hypothetical protein HELRODRAFT_155962 [Helobdella robusta]|uniref:BTB domain-containing protein n=1 Tax=Helobdella robusta TaxID=6412 RepID=T1ELP8_HELRO|nr:hypothetical protein HELRODRAFT_155962 [Helobdella robusta]ESN99210.1 hypothetical protein HELRODRAFT_155962 [Helobdella robusta]